MWSLRLSFFPPGRVVMALIIPADVYFQFHTQWHHRGSSNLAKEGVVASCKLAFYFRDLVYQHATAQKYKYVYFPKPSWIMRNRLKQKDGFGLSLWDYWTLRRNVYYSALQKSCSRSVGTGSLWSGSRPWNPPHHRMTFTWKIHDRA